MTPDAAIQTAMDTVKQLFGGNDSRLEEIEFKDNGDVEVTISYRLPAGSQAGPVAIGSEPALAGLTGRRAAIGIDPYRTYKDVLISSEGHVKAVRMRQIVVG